MVKSKFNFTVLNITLFFHVNSFLLGAIYREMKGVISIFN